MIVNIIPLEVKSGCRTKAKSLSQYKRKYNPQLSIKLSFKNLRIENNHINAPIYMAGSLHQLITNK